MERPRGVEDWRGSQECRSDLSLSWFGERDTRVSRKAGGPRESIAAFSSAWHDCLCVTECMAALPHLLKMVQLLCCPQCFRPPCVLLLLKGLDARLCVCEATVPTITRAHGNAVTQLHQAALVRILIGDYQPHSCESSSTGGTGERKDEEAYWLFV